MYKDILERGRFQGVAVAFVIFKRRGIFFQTFFFFYLDTLRKLNGALLLDLIYL